MRQRIEGKNYLETTKLLSHCQNSSTDRKQSMSRAKKISITNLPNNRQIAIIRFGNGGELLSATQQVDYIEECEKMAK